MNQQTLENHDRTSTSDFTTSLHGTFHHGDTPDVGPDPTDDYFWVSSFNPKPSVSTDPLAGTAEQQQATFRFGLDEQPPHEFDASLNDFRDSFYLSADIAQNFPQEYRRSTTFLTAYRHAEKHFDNDTIHTTNINRLRHTGDPDADARANWSKVHLGQIREWMLTTINPDSIIYSATPRTFPITYRIINDQPESPTEAFQIPFSPQKKSEYATLMAKLIKEFASNQTKLRGTIRSSFTVPTHIVHRGIATDETLDPSQQALRLFASGLNGQPPTQSALNKATQLINAAAAKAVAYEFEFDDTDASLPFEIRLTDGHLVIGELSSAGDIHANVYNDQHPDTGAGISDIWVHHLPQSSAQELINLF